MLPIASTNYQQKIIILDNGLEAGKKNTNTSLLKKCEVIEKLKNMNVACRHKNVNEIGENCRLFHVNRNL